MRTTNYSNEHARARVYGWNGGNTASGSGGVVVTDGTTTVNASQITVGQVDDGGGGDAQVLSGIEGGWSAGSGVLTWAGGRPRLIYPDSTTPTDGLDVSAASTQLFSQHTPGDLTDQGVVIEAGDDYVGIRLSEKDASTLQIYTDVAGGYTVEFVERTAGHFEFVVSGGAARAVPAMGMLPSYAAAPHSGTEIESESYYNTTTHKAYTWDGSTWQAWW